jgi:hypothetical protein
MWLWNNLKVTGGTDWVAQAIALNSLVAVTDGSYIKEHYPDLCFAAFVLKCTQGGGRTTGAFPDASVVANAFLGGANGPDGGTFAPTCGKYCITRPERSGEDIF